MALLSSLWPDWLQEFFLSCFLQLSLLEILFHLLTASTMMATCESFVITVQALLMAWMVNLSLSWTMTINKQSVTDPDLCVRWGPPLDPPLTIIIKKVRGTVD